ncbi:MAG: ABC transporter permease [Firmicutes bacterium]|nr:ABC transporter permease [Bacillota bacterium]
MSTIPGRIFSFLLTLWLVSLFTFIVFQVIPGNPAQVILGAEALPEQVAALEKELGLDKPLYLRYLHWIGGIFRGDFGNSLRYGQPVRGLMVESLKVTLPVAGLALVFIVLLGFPLGLTVGKYHAQKQGVMLSVVAQLGTAIPSFWLGILMMLAFAKLFRFFTPGAFIPWDEDWLKALASLVPPALAVALPKVAVLTRYVSTAYVEEKRADYIRTAYAKGLAEKEVLYVHLLKNILIPVVTVLGLMSSDILGGSIIVEKVFALPGIGRLLIEAISFRDFPLIQAIALYLAGVVVSLNLLVDLSYSIFDPRIRWSR